MADAPRVAKRLSGRPLAIWATCAGHETSLAPSPTLSATTIAPQPSETAAAFGVAEGRRVQSRRSSVDARCLPPTPPITVLLAARSMVVTIGALSLLLGRQDALLAVEMRLWRWDKMGQNGTQKRACGEAKHAGKEARACMLKALGPSSWAAGATESRLPVDAD